MIPPPVPSLTPYDWFKVAFTTSVGMGLVFMVLYVTAGKNKKKVFTLTNFWFVLSGVMHSWIELSFVMWRADSCLKNALDLYAAADYRYGNPMESGTAAMEAITAYLDGPLCFIVAYSYIHSTAYLHPTVVVLCVMQIYGLIWYSIQPIFSVEGFKGYLTEDPFLFWAVDFACNFPWMVLPPIFLYKSFKELVNKQHVN